MHLFVLRAKSLMCQNGPFVRSVALFHMFADFLSFSCEGKKKYYNFIICDYYNPKLIFHAELGVFSDIIWDARQVQWKM